MVDIHERSIEALQAQFAAGELNAVELTRAHLPRIERFDGTLNAVQTLNPEALQVAAALDDERAESGPRSLLHGIPVLVKDNYETRGMTTTAGSALFAGFAPDRDACLVERLCDAGAVVLGKTTMHEFAYGITTVGSGFDLTRNAYDASRNPGGSSGGTGAAIAAGFAVAGMGSDTCGSIRIPASHGNLVGLRGTQGLSSRRGIVPLSHTQDIGGPLAKSVRDLAILLDATVGPDPRDPQTLESLGKIPPSYLEDLAELTPGAIRLGVLTDRLIQEDDDEVVARVIDAGLEELQGLGVAVSRFFAPQIAAALDRELNGHFVLIHDFKTDINAYLADNAELGFENIDALIEDGRVHENVMSSLTASAAMTEESEPQYLRELKQREVVRQALLGLMVEHRVDALVYPTIRREPAPVGETQLGTNCQLSANSGLPAITVPFGFTDQGLPVGLELLAEPWSEQKLLNLAYTIERRYPQRRAPVLGE